MGIHYVNGDLVGDGALDAQRLELEGLVRKAYDGVTGGGDEG